MTESWQSLIPATRGRLPGDKPGKPGELLHRTDPGGNLDADIAVLGLYPAARVSQRTVGDLRMSFR